MEQLRIFSQEVNVDRDYFETRANILKALAHPSRLMIVDELVQRGTVRLRSHRTGRP